MIKVLTLGLALSLSAITIASAEEAEDHTPDFRINMGAGYTPDYEGSAHYELVPYLDAQANFGNYFARFEAAELSFNLLDSKSFHLGPVVGFRRTRGDDVHNAAVARMERIPYSITAGGFLEYQHHYEDPRYGERLTLTVVNGTFHSDTGVNAVLRGVIHRPLKFVNEGLIASLSADTTWGSNRYMRTYYGVNTPDSIASGLPAFDAGSGFSSVGVGASLDQYLSRNWSVGLRFHYARMVGDAADSPVTSIAGNPNQFFFGLTVGYVM